MDRQVTSTGPLDGSHVVLALSGSAIGAALATALTAAGARVSLLSDTALAVDGIERPPTDFSSRLTLELAFDQAAGRNGPIDAAVHSATPACALVSRPLVELSAAEWQASCNGALKSTLFTLQAAHRAFNGKGGAIVLTGPTLALTGVKGLVPLSSLLESQRGLAKSAARQLGPPGITVNWTAMASARFAPELAGLAYPQSPELGPPPLPLGGAPEVEAVAQVIAFLSSKHSRMITGATLNIDGGEWMLP
jgi:3-oxoacyl-[acyl-carrier protein] reductase